MRFLLCVCAYHMLGRLTTQIAERNKKIFVYNFGLGLKANLFFRKTLFINGSQTKVKQLAVLSQITSKISCPIFSQWWAKFANGNWKGQINWMRALNFQIAWQIVQNQLRRSWKITYLPISITSRTHTKKCVKCVPRTFENVLCEFFWVIFFVYLSMRKRTSVRDYADIKRKVRFILVLVYAYAGTSIGSMAPKSKQIGYVLKTCVKCACCKNAIDFFASSL